MGFGLIKIVKNKMTLIQMNELVLNKLDDHYLRLKHIFERTIDLIEKYNPDEISIEAPWEKCSVYVKIRQSSRSSNGCWTF